MSNIRCGIDLGTTFSAISWYDVANQRVETIDLVECSDGAKMVRSVVYYPGAGQVPVVGETAWNAARSHRDRVIDTIKRAMGTGYTKSIDGVDYTPPQVSAEILKALAKDARTSFFGQGFQDVVITVPAHFGDNERAATLEAGKLAGLNVLELLPEPHAAALAFAVDQATKIADKYLLVYDLGGGTFDVTLIHVVSEGRPGDTVRLKINTLCKSGNAHLGGVDWDKAMAEIVAEKILSVHKVDIRQDPGNEAFLLDSCEKAKRHLSRASSVSIVGDPANHQVDVSRSEFEDRTRDLLMQSEALMDVVLNEAQEKHGVSRDRIEVLLAGGSSKMPMVREMIAAKMGKPPLQHGNPDLLVTIGAAYWAHMLGSAVPHGPDQQAPPPAPVEKKEAGPTGGTQTTKVEVLTTGLTDTGNAVGVEVVRLDTQGKRARFNSVIVPQGARHGDEFEKTFSTSEDNMTEISVVLYEGDSPDLGLCKQLMTFTIGGLPSGRPKGRRVTVNLGYDRSGIIRGRAIDDETKSAAEIIVDRSKATFANTAAQSS